MDLQPPSIAKSRTPVRRKFDAPGLGPVPRVYAEEKEKPFSRLAGSDLLDTADLCRLFGVSARTLYRWVAEYGLQPSIRVGREYLFRKDAIVKWCDKRRPVHGRPRGR